MKILLFKAIFIFSQLVSLFLPLNTLELSDLTYLSDRLEFYNLNAEQKTELKHSLLIAAGIDGKLSDIEWQSFLNASPSLKYNSNYVSFLQFVNDEFKRNAKIKPGILGSLYLKASFKASELLNEPEENYHLIVLGNELTSVAVAVSAAKALKHYKIEPKILLIRKNKADEPFGGLLVQGGLAYLDRNQINANLTPSSEFYREFLKRAKVKRVAADPEAVDVALKAMLLEANVQILHNSVPEPFVMDGEIKYLKVCHPLTPLTGGIESKSPPACQGEGVGGEVTTNQRVKQTLKANNYVDTTQDAELARAAGLKYSIGFQTLGFPGSTLPVSPVFRTEGLSVAELQKIEQKIINNPVLMEQIKDKLNAELEKNFVDWLIEKVKLPMHIGEDFVDFRSIALGAAYHLYRNKPYDFKKGFLFDRPNIAILGDRELSWNSLLYKFSSQEVLEIADGGSKTTEEMLTELKEFEKWLNSFEVAKEVRVIPPGELYIRQSINILDVKEPFTGQQMLRGGVPPEKAVGTFCYYFDVRGGIQGFGGKMPKPIFNFGIEHSLSQIPNLAIVGRSAGYYGLAPAAGRILEINASIGSFIGAAAAIASKEARPIYSVTSKEAKALIERISGVPVNLQGKDLSKGYEGSGII